MLINLKVTELKAALECAANKDIRNMLNGVCIDIINESEVMIVSTNGHYLFACKADIDDMTTDYIGQIIIPIESLKMALKTIDKKANYIALRSADNNSFYLGNNTIFTRIDGLFPDYTRVIPQSVSGEIGDFNVDYLATISKAMQIYSSNKYGHKLHHNGENGPSVMAHYNAIAVLMPMRFGGSPNYTGFVFPKPKKAIAA